ncbi:MAG: hypothetical protein Q8936_06565 [Bacillota bacterium]|nr:hypothetical protein [Bacillota bacterium]
MKKKLRFTEGIEDLTFEQVLERFKKFRNKTSCEWINALEIDKDDAKQIIDIEIWKAFMAYDIKLNTNFSTIAFKYVMQEQQRLWRKSEASSRKNKYGPDYYLDKKIGEGGEDFYRYVKKGEFEADVLLEVTICNLLKKYKPNQKRSVEMMMEGYSGVEILEKVPISHTTLTKYKKEFVQALEG